MFYQRLIAFFAIFFILFCLNVRASVQDSITFTIRINHLDQLDLIAEFNDGLVLSPLVLTDDSVHLFQRPVYSPFPSLQITAQNGAYRQVFLLEQTGADLNFTASRDKDGLPLIVHEITHAVSISDTLYNNLWRDLRKYEREELVALSAFFVAHGFRKQATDSLNNRMVSLIKDANEKSLEFLAMHSDNFQAFYHFKNTVLILSDLIQNDVPYFKHLIHFYEETFPETFRHTAEGEYILLGLKQRIHPVLLSENTMMPNVLFKDVNGRAILLKETEQPYVLLDFWASWCPPCLKQLPDLKDLRNNFPKDKLKMISVSIDRDTIAFTKAINDHKINWINCFDRGGIMSSGLGIESIPVVLLLDRSGKIVYYKQGGRVDTDRIRKIILSSATTEQ